MRRRKLDKTIEGATDEMAKAKVLAVLQGLSGEKTIAQICRETGLKPMAYYKMEGQMVKAMMMAAQASSENGQKSKALLESDSLLSRNEALRKENLRIQSMLRLTKKLFRNGPKRRRRGRKPGRKPGRPPKTNPANPPVKHQLKEAASTVNE